MDRLRRQILSNPRNVNIQILYLRLQMDPKNNRYWQTKSHLRCSLSSQMTLSSNILSTKFQKKWSIPSRTKYQQPTKIMKILMTILTMMRRTANHLTSQKPRVALVSNRIHLAATRTTWSSQTTSLTKMPRKARDRMRVMSKKRRMRLIATLKAIKMTVMTQVTLKVTLAR